MHVWSECVLNLNILFGFQTLYVSVKQIKFMPHLIFNSLARYIFKVKNFATNFQMQAIPLMMDRRQVLVCAPTGSGKTAAYLVPLVHLLSQKVDGEPKKKSISAVIVAPTRELVILCPLSLKASRTPYIKCLKSELVVDFTHSVNVWFPNSLDFRHIFFSKCV